MEAWVYAFKLKKEYATSGPFPPLNKSKQHPFVIARYTMSDQNGGLLLYSLLL